ncbi:NAD(P)/FAD-dependent oxidoreductase [Pseudonocardia sp. RS010]|uniref:NAD(P)/FAD-dependent oxidoreductase n=1 Tax=Pseudonocardia sp. RS010 TaxID=3385979 RepID=UPI0039A144DC
MHTITIVGGGPAALAASLVLSRSCRKPVVICGDLTVEAPEVSARERIAASWTKLKDFGAEVIPERAIAVSQLESGAFSLRLSSERILRSRALLLCTGITEKPPQIEGIHELWGTLVHSCLYCHGWEVQGEPLAVIGHGDRGAHLAIRARGWSHDVTLYTDGAQPSASLITDLTNLGINLQSAPVLSVDKAPTGLNVTTKSSTAEHRCMFVVPTVRQQSNLAEQLGCRMRHVEELDLAEGAVATDTAGQTSVRMVFAAGTLVDPTLRVAGAEGQGNIVAIATNEELMRAGFLY